MIKCWRRDGVNYLQPLLTSLALGPCESHDQLAGDGDDGEDGEDVG